MDPETMASAAAVVRAVSRWECVCTFVNEGMWLQCVFCHREKPGFGGDRAEWACLGCTFRNDSNSLQCRSCGQLKGARTRRPNWMETERGAYIFHRRVGAQMVEEKCIRHFIRWVEPIHRAGRINPVQIGGTRYWPCYVEIKGYTKIEDLRYAQDRSLCHACRMYSVRTTARGKKCERYDCGARGHASIINLVEEDNCRQSSSWSKRGRTETHGKNQKRQKFSSGLPSSVNEEHGCLVIQNARVGKTGNNDVLEIECASASASHAAEVDYGQIGAAGDLPACVSDCPSVCELDCFWCQNPADNTQAEDHVWDEYRTDDKNDENDKKDKNKWEKSILVRVVFHPSGCLYRRCQEIIRTSPIPDTVEFIIHMKDTRREGQSTNGQLDEVLHIRIFQIIVPPNFPEHSFRQAKQKAKNDSGFVFCRKNFQYEKRIGSVLGMDDQIPHQNGKNLYSISTVLRLKVNSYMVTATVTKFKLNENEGEPPYACCDYKVFERNFEQAITTNTMSAFFPENFEILPSYWDPRAAPENSFIGKTIAVRKYFVPSGGKRRLIRTKAYIPVTLTGIHTVGENLAAPQQLAGVSSSSSSSSSSLSSALSSRKTPQKATFFATLNEPQSKDPPLIELDVDQVLLGRTKYAKVHSGIFIEFFAGSCGLSAAFYEQGAKIYSFDGILRKEDWWDQGGLPFLEEQLLSIFQKEIGSGPGQVQASQIMVYFGIPCRYWTSLNSINNLTRTRDGESSRDDDTGEYFGGPWGKRTNRKIPRSGGVTRKHENLANSQLIHMLKLCHQMVNKYRDRYPGIQYCFENGSQSFLWDAAKDYKEKFRGESNPLDINLQPLIVDVCCFAAAWRKPTRFATNCEALHKAFRNQETGEQVYKCRCNKNKGERDEKEVHMAITDIGGGCSTRDTSAYPSLLCKKIASIVCSQDQWEQIYDV